MGPIEILLSVVFPILVALGFGMAVTDASSYEFLFAKACIVSAALIVTVVVSHSLWPRSGKPVYSRLITWVVTIVVVWVALIYSVQWIGLREDRVSTIIHPSNKPTPSLPPSCNAPPKDAFLVFWGTNVSWSEKMPHTILNMGGEDILVVDQKENNLIISNLRVFDDRNDIIARFDPDEVWIRSDTRRQYKGNSITIYDHKDEPVLNIDFLNPKALRITGVFHHPKTSATWVITEDSNSNDPRYSCFKNNRADIVIP